MRRFLVPGVVTAVAVGLLVLLAFGIRAQHTPTNKLDAAVDSGHYPLAPNAGLELPRIAGHGSIDLASLRGKVVLVNMFASWCESCQYEQRLIERTERMLNRHDGTVLGVSYKDNAPADVAYARQYHLTYPIVSDASGTFADSYGTLGVPETYVIGRDGRIMAIRRTVVTTQWLNRTLPRILAEG